VETGTENETARAEFLHHLVDRGLRCEQGLLVIMDGGKGLRAAVRQHLYLREVRFYQRIAPHVGMRTAAAYFADVDEESGAFALLLEHLSPAQRVAERLILGLRTADGVPTAALAERAGGHPTLSRTLADWRDTGRLVDEGGRTRLSEAGFLVSDALFVDLL